MSPSAAMLQRWREDPALFVRQEFGVTPQEWQLEALRAFPRVNRLAMKACKGPGKTALLAWVVLNFLVTRPHCRIGCISITGDNLDQNLWPELAKWMNRSPFCRATFTWTKTTIVHKSHAATWWAQARAYAKAADQTQQNEALAGLHEDYAMVVLDESGGIPQGVMVAAEAVLSSGIETKVVQAGNPTRLTGPLYRACTTERGVWHVIEITGDPDDPKRSPNISLEWARQQITTYGRDNPWVMVNVLGKFPPSSLNSLLGPDDVHAAMNRSLPEDAYTWAQKRLGVDVARYGDDRTVIFPRQGLVAFRPHVMRHSRNSTVSVDIANRVMGAKAKWGSELEFFDATGGWAAGAVDVLRSNGFSPIDVQFAAPSFDNRYRNRRAEIWFLMAKWVQEGGALPNVPEMVPELTEPTYTFSDGKFVLEDKAQIKARLGSSPDLADALALTFGIVDMPGGSELGRSVRPYAHAGKVKTDFDPFAMEAR